MVLQCGGKAVSVMPAGSAPAVVDVEGFEPDIVQHAHIELGHMTAIPLMRGRLLHLRDEAADGCGGAFSDGPHEPSRMSEVEAVKR